MHILRRLLATWWGSNEPLLAEQLRHLLMRPVVNVLSVDPRGQWSEVQARKVLEIIQPQAAKQGLFFQMLEITDHSMPNKRFILVAYCKEHKVAIPVDDVCPQCRDQYR